MIEIGSAAIDGDGRRDARRRFVSNCLIPFSIEISHDSAAANHRHPA
jgi:hypothetical protein